MTGGLKCSNLVLAKLQKRASPNRFFFVGNQLGKNVKAARTKYQRWQRKVGKKKLVKEKESSEGRRIRNTEFFER